MIAIFFLGLIVGMWIGAFAYMKGVEHANKPTMYQLTDGDYWLSERRKANARMQAYLDEQRGKP